MPYPPTYAKVNPADAPVLTLALTSPTISLRNLSDLADTLMAQRLAEVGGVGRVSIQGGIRPAVRIQADLTRLAAYGIGLEDIRQAIVGANVSGAKGSLDGAHQSYTISANDQLIGVDSYKSLVVAYRNGAPVLLTDVAQVVDGLENDKVGAWYQGTPAVVIDIQRQPGANVIETVERVKAELPRLQRAMPVGVTLTIVNDRTTTIRASIHDVQFTLVLSVVLVVLVVLMFLRTVRATIIAGVALPLSLIATFGVMWFCGFSLDNLSLMALTIGTGFVVDDAIVMIENIVRHIEDGESPLDAALRGAREIGFTVISLTMSLIAVFIPLLFMTGLVGRMFREFALTLTIAVVVSAIVSLTLTPMMCSRLLRHQAAKAGNRCRPLLQPGARSDGRILRPKPGMGAAPPAADVAGHAGDARRHRLALYRHAEGLPAVAGHRADLRRVGGRHRGVVRPDAAAAGAGRGRDQEGPGRHRPCFDPRRQPDEPDAERRPPRHHACARATSAAPPSTTSSAA